MLKSDLINELAEALAKAQAELKAPPKDKINPHFKNKYADLATIIATVQPVLARHGLSVAQLAGSAPNGVSLETVLMHKSGQWISTTLVMPSEKQNAQGVGSALTYARRYAYSSIVNVAADDDDDGNEAATRAPIKSNGNGSKPYGPPAGPSPEEQEADRLEKVCAAGFDNEIAKLQWKAAYRDIINGLPKDRKQSVVAAFEKAAVRGA